MVALAQREEFGAEARVGADAPADKERARFDVAAFQQAFEFEDDSADGGALETRGDIRDLLFGEV